MAVQDLILNNESNPDFLDLFGDNAEDLFLWLEVTECKLEDLEIDYVDQIAMVELHLIGLPEKEISLVWWEDPRLP